MVVKKEKTPQTSADEVRVFSYRRKWADDLARIGGILLFSVVLPVIGDTTEQPEGWKLAFFVVMGLGLLGSSRAVWRRIRDVRRHQVRDERITVASRGLTYEDRTCLVQVAWEDILSLGAYGHTHLIQTRSSVVAFTEDLWDWEDLLITVSSRAPKAVEMTPEEAVRTFSNISYPAPDLF